MKGLDSISNSVQKNCDLVDAEYAQNYGLCVYLLKMREYYRWKNHISNTIELHNDKIHDWIVDQEEHWEEIEGDSFQKITIGDNSFSPFETEEINEVLNPERLVYSGGKGYGDIPMFFWLIWKMSGKGTD